MPGKIARLLLRKGRRDNSNLQMKSDNVQPHHQQALSSATVQLEGDQSSLNSGASATEKRHPASGSLLRRLTGRLTATARRRTKQQQQQRNQQQQQAQQQLSADVHDRNQQLAPLPLADAYPMPAESAKLLRPPSPMRPHLMRTAAPAVHRAHRRHLLTPVCTDCGPLADASDTETAELSSVSAAKMESLSLKATASSDSSDYDNEDDADSLVSDCVLRLRMTTTEATDSISINNCNNQRRLRSRLSHRPRRWANNLCLPLEVPGDADSCCTLKTANNCPSCQGRSHLPHWPV